MEAETETHKECERMIDYIINIECSIFLNVELLKLSLCFFLLSSDFNHDWKRITNYIRRYKASILVIFWLLERRTRKQLQLTVDFIGFRLIMTVFNFWLNLKQKCTQKHISNEKKKPFFCCEKKSITIITFTSDSVFQCYYQNSLELNHWEFSSRALFERILVHCYWF